MLLLVMAGAILTHLLNFESLGLPLLPAGMMAALGFIIAARNPSRVAT